MWYEYLNIASEEQSAMLWKCLRPNNMKQWNDYERDTGTKDGNGTPGADACARSLV